MAVKLAERVKEGCTGTGLNNLVLTGPVTGFRSFTDALADGDETIYVVVDGTEWEVGIGTMVSATELSRDTILDSSQTTTRVNTSTPGSPVKIALSDQSHTVAIALNALRLVFLDADGNLITPTPFRNAVILENLAAMTAIPDPVDNEGIMVKHGASEGDGLGGLFFWDAADAGAENPPLSYEHDTEATGLFKRVKFTLDALLLGTQDVFVYKGVIDCSANPNYPAADSGHTYRVSVAGKIGGASGVNVQVGDLLTCAADSTASGTQAAVGSSWGIVQANIDGAVIGPASATNNALAQFDGTSGKLLKDGPAAASMNFSVANLATLEALTAGSYNSVFMLGRTAVGDAGGGLFAWVSGNQSANVSADPAQAFWVAPSSDATGASGAWKRIYEGMPDVRWFGITCDGTDETTEFQQWIDYRIESVMPLGVIGVTGVQWKPGALLHGTAGKPFHAYVETRPADDEVSWIRYIGSAGANTYAINCSLAAVGTAPVAQIDGSTDMFHGGIIGVMVDGGDGDFGLYVARTGYQFKMDVTVTGSKKRGFWMAKCWGFSNWSIKSILTGSTGISIGENYFSWPASEINAGHFAELHALKPGVDKGFNESTALREGNGINWEPLRSTICTNMTSEITYGVPVFDAAGVSCKIENLHMEYAGLFDIDLSDDRDDDRDQDSALANGDMTDDWFLWIQSDSGQYQKSYGQIWCAGAGGDSVPKIRIAGTAPAAPIVFESLFGVDEIVADHGVYEIHTAEPALVDSNATLPAITRHLPQVGVPGSLINARTTIYCGNLASNSGTTGNGSGVDASNLMPLTAAIEVARVSRGVTTLDLSAVTSGAAGLGPELDGSGIDREIIIDGGTTGRLTNDATNSRGIKLKNFACRVTFRNMLTIDRVYLENCRDVVFDDCPGMRMGSDSSTGAALNIDGSNVLFAGTSVINPAASSAATKIAVALSRNGRICFSEAASGTLTGYTAGNAFHFNEGAGEVHVSTTTETCAWARQSNITKNTGGACGIVYAPNGVNPYGGAKRQSVTIAAGVVTISKGARFVLIDTEASASTDDLDTINYTGGEDGDIVYFAAANGTRDVVFKDGTGNMKLSGDFTCDTLDDIVALMWDAVASDWKELAESNN